MFSKIKLNVVMLVVLFFPVLLLSQVANGSFESDGQPTLENWHFTCDLHESSSNDVPDLPDNYWSLKLASGNSQGCFPSYAYQIIPDIRDGEIWKASVYTRRQNYRTQPKLYWKIFKANGDQKDLPAATTSSYYWDRISVESVIIISEGDSVAIILDAGLIVNEPTINYVFFDFVQVEKVGDVYNSPDEISEVHLNNFKLFQNYPNPFNPITTLSYELKKAGEVELSIYNIKGEKVRTLVKQQQPIGLYKIMWNGKDNNNKSMGSNEYFYQLKVNNKIISLKKMILIK